LSQALQRVSYAICMQPTQERKLLAAQAAVHGHTNWRARCCFERGKKSLKVCLDRTPEL
jgi:hypothetical protein